MGTKDFWNAERRALKAQVISNDDSLNCLSNMNKMQPFRGSYITCSPRPSFISQLYRLHENGTRIWHLLSTSLSGKWFHTTRAAQNPHPWKNNQGFPITSLVPSQKLLCAEKELFWTINAVKISQNSHSYPRKFRLSWHLQQFGLLMRLHSAGTQNLSFRWWDLLLYFSSNDLYNGKLREKTKSCSFLSQRSTEITTRANEVTQHFSSPSRKPTKSSSLNQLFNISAADRYYGY